MLWYPNVYILLLARLVDGFGIGLVINLVPAYISDYTIKNAWTGLSWILCLFKIQMLQTLRVLLGKNEPYTVCWMDWDKSIVPVRTYILDVTNSGQWSHSSSRAHYQDDCQAEYDVAPCFDVSSPSECIYTRESTHGWHRIHQFSR